MVVPKSIYDPNISLGEVESVNPNFGFKWSDEGFTSTKDLDFPLTGIVVSSKQIMYETSARIEAGLGIIRGILRHRQEFGKAEINSLKQDLYENLDIVKVSKSHNSHAIVWSRENEEESKTKKMMESHNGVIDAFIDQMLEDGVISEDGGEYLISIE